MTNKEREIELCESIIRDVQDFTRPLLPLNGPRDYRFSEGQLDYERGLLNAYTAVESLLRRRLTELKESTRDV